MYNTLLIIFGDKIRLTFLGILMFSISKDVCAVIIIMITLNIVTEINRPGLSKIRKALAAGYRI